MKKTFSILALLAVSLSANDTIVNQDILERFNIVCTRTEWVIKSDHEYYMMDVPRAYGLQAIRNENDKLYKILINPPVLEKKLLNVGRAVLRELKKNQKEKVLILPEKKEKSRVTFYSFSSVN
ncbi:MAG: hypothetical protein H8E70_01550 [Candidatus Marinimicrobia bacterium]|nr:hypothetical protein [Candidatus Neomarinimicrobiota bacterium]